MSKSICHTRFLPLILMVLMVLPAWSRGAGKLLDKADSLYAVQQYQEALVVAL